MMLDIHWIEIGLTLIVMPIVIWYLRKINIAVETLPILNAMFQAHETRDDDRFKSLQRDIAHIRK